MMLTSLIEEVVSGAYVDLVDLLRDAVHSLAQHVASAGCADPACIYTLPIGALISNRVDVCC